MKASLALIDLSGSSQPSDKRMVLGNLGHFQRISALALGPNQSIQTGISDMSVHDQSAVDPNDGKRRAHVSAVHVETDAIQFFMNRLKEVFQYLGIGLGQDTIIQGLGFGQHSRQLIGRDLAC